MGSVTLNGYVRSTTPVAQSLLQQAHQTVLHKEILLPFSNVFDSPFVMVAPPQATAWLLPAPGVGLACVSAQQVLVRLKNSCTEGSLKMTLCIIGKDSLRIK